VTLNISGPYTDSVVEVDVNKNVDCLLLLLFIIYYVLILFNINIIYCYFSYLLNLE